jgi:hypothetical protein
MSIWPSPTDTIGIGIGRDGASGLGASGIIRGFMDLGVQMLLAIRMGEAAPEERVDAGSDANGMKALAEAAHAAINAIETRIGGCLRETATLAFLANRGSLLPGCSNRLRRFQAQ